MLMGCEPRWPETVLTYVGGRAVKSAAQIAIASMWLADTARTTDFALPPQRHVRTGRWPDFWTGPAEGVDFHGLCRYLLEERYGKERL